MHWLTTAATAALLLGAAHTAVAQDQDLDELKRKIREEVARELAPKFRQQADELKQRFEREARALQEQFRRMVDEAVERRLRKLRTPERPVEPKPVEPRPVRPAAGGKPYLGLRLAEATEGVRVLLNLGDTGGLVVRYVEDGGPADRAGLKLEDVILSFHETRVGTLAELRDVLGGLHGGQTVTVEYLREGRKHRMEFTLGNRGGDAPAAPVRPVRPVRPVPPPPPAAGPRGRIHSLLGKVGGRMLDAIQAQLDDAADAAERSELMRIVARKLLERLDAPTDRDHAEMMRALKMGLRRYLESAAAAGASRAQRLEALLERMVAKGAAAAGGKKRDVRKLLDDILGPAGPKKPGKAHKPDKPQQPQIPDIDPAKLRDELERLRAKIEKEGFPQDEAGVRKLVDALLQRMNTNREQVRRLVEMMGGIEGAKPLVRQQLEMMGLPLTDADIDRVMKALMGDKAGGTKPAKTVKRKRAGKVGMGLSFTAEGASVQRVVDGSPADKAGLKVGDLVLRIGKARAGDRDAVRAELSNRWAGETLEVKIRRDGIERTLTLTLAAKE